MGLGKYFYTAKNEGRSLSVREQIFFGLRVKEPTKVKKPRKPKALKVEPTDNKNVGNLLDGLI